MYVDFEQEAAVLLAECQSRREARACAKVEAAWLMSRRPGYSVMRARRAIFRRQINDR